LDLAPVRLVARGHRLRGEEYPTAKQSALRAPQQRQQQPEKMGLPSLARTLMPSLVELEPKVSTARMMRMMTTMPRRKTTPAVRVSGAPTVHAGEEAEEAEEVEQQEETHRARDSQSGAAARRPRSRRPGSGAAKGNPRPKPAAVPVPVRREQKTAPPPPAVVEGLLLCWAALVTTPQTATRTT
jgi:hypothetical protein